MKLILYIFIALVMTACAKIEKEIITIDTMPHGANISVAEKNTKTDEIVKTEIGISPVQYEIVPKRILDNSTTYTDSGGLTAENHTKTIIPDPKYTIYAKKDGYFMEEKSIEDYDDILESGKFTINLEKSPMWWATTTSSATNQWINLIVSSQITDKDMWQRVVDAVTKRFPNLKEYDFTSGYLVTVPKVKTYDTSRGTFILRSKFIATVMQREPLTYRLKLISQWSNQEGVKWNPYPRVFIEDDALIKELMTRFQDY